MSFPSSFNSCIFPNVLLNVEDALIPNWSTAPCHVLIFLKPSPNTAAIASALYKKESMLISFILEESMSMASSRLIPREIFILSKSSAFCVWNFTNDSLKMSSLFVAREISYCRETNPCVLILEPIWRIFSSLANKLSNTFSVRSISFPSPPESPSKTKSFPTSANFFRQRSTALSKLLLSTFRRIFVSFGNFASF